MKIQKILKSMDENSRAFLIRQLIISRLDDIKELQERVAQNEAELAEEIRVILKRDTKLDEFDPFFDLVVSNHKDENFYQDTLLNTICIQIAQSIRDLYDQPEEKGNSFINYGGKHFAINFSELQKNFQLEPSGDFSGLFEKFNEAMKPYDVRIKQMNQTASEISPLSIHIRILS